MGEIQNKNCDWKRDETGVLVLGISYFQTNHLVIFSAPEIWLRIGIAEVNWTKKCEDDGIAIE